MVKITRERALERFNQGCAFFQQSIEAFSAGDLPAYESSITSAAREVIGALEWILKIYLRQFCQGKIAPEDQIMLKQPNFNDLMTLMQKYADPPMDQAIVSDFYGYRELRNASEHGASIPPFQDIHDAIEIIRQTCITYLRVPEEQIAKIHIPQPGTNTASKVKSQSEPAESTFSPGTEWCGKSLVVAEPYIRITCDFPQAFGDVSCEIELSRTAFSDFTINVPHRHVLGDLMMGLGTPPDKHTRRFIRQVENNNFEATLGQVTLRLLEAEALDLCACVDQVCTQYKQMLLEAEKLLEVQDYLLVREDDIPGWGFHLASVSPELWEYINKFTREFDYDRGDSEWHIFDGRGDWIRVSGHKGSRFLDHAFIYAKEGGNLPPGFVYLTYGVPEWFLETIGRVWGLWKDNIGPRGIWTARYTRDWLLSKFIPQVCKHYGRDVQVHCNDVYSTSATTFSINHTPMEESKEQIPLQDVVDPKQLSDYVDETHSWLYNYGLNISTKILFDFFQAFRDLVQEVDPKSVDVGYITGKLYVIERGWQKDTVAVDKRFEEKWTYKDVLIYLNEYIDRLSYVEYMSSEDAELLLRVFSAILKGRFKHFHQSELNAVKRTMQAVWELGEFERRYVVTQWRWTGLWYE